jgi:hypothetical protein
MNLQQIKQAVNSGHTVHWKNKAYSVIVDSIGQWLIICHLNDYCFGLTWRDEITMNGKPEDFYIEQ